MSQEESPSTSVTDTSRVLKEVRQVLDERIRPRVQSHAGDIRIASVSEAANGEVIVRLGFLGACTGCHLRPVTYFATIKKPLEDIQGVAAVECDQVRVSRHAAERITNFFGYEP